MIELLTNLVIVLALVLWGYYLGVEGHEELTTASTLGGKIWVWVVLVVVTAAYAAALVCAYDLIRGMY